MNEKLLQFIWRYQYFNFSQLLTTDGEKLEIVHPGLFNTNQGPDFLEGKIRIDATTLVGQIELHVRTSDWLKHKHGADDNYQNVILHVVWFHDVTLPGEKMFPTLELQSFTSQILLDRYAYLMQRQLLFVPCQQSLPVLSEIGWTHWKERLGVERLERKSTEILKRLQDLQGDWQAVFWEELAYNFGLKNNAEHFRNMAMSVSWRILSKQKYSVTQLEAIMMGQCGLLNGIIYIDAYPNLLKREYDFLKKKYAFNPTTGKLAFLRMRPQNFPTIRLSQLAYLIYQSPHLFSQLLEITEKEQCYTLLDVSASEYWNNHFVFDKLQETAQVKKMGKMLIDNIIINTIVPFLFAYGIFFQKESYKERAVYLLEQCQPECNTLVNGWKSAGIAAVNALDTQALLELYKQYCLEKKCLQCAVGTLLLKL